MPLAALPILTSYILLALLAAKLVLFKFLESEFFLFWGVEQMIRVKLKLIPFLFKWAFHLHQNNFLLTVPKYSLRVQALGAQLIIHRSNDT